MKYIFFLGLSLFISNAEGMKESAGSSSGANSLQAWLQKVIKEREQARSELENSTRDQARNNQELTVLQRMTFSERPTYEQLANEIGRDREIRFIEECIYQRNLNIASIQKKLKDLEREEKYIRDAILSSQVPKS